MESPNSDLSPLIDAAQKSDYLSILTNLQYARRTNSNGQSALMLCAVKSCVEGAVVLANNEAKMTDISGNTALMYAVKSNCMPIVKLLLPFEQNMVNNNGETALQVATRYSSNQQIISLLEQVEIARPPFQQLLEEVV
ncbi:Kinase [Hexamita inflata]|uniref:Kinase n=1 Tax=Hexamita inflata TaxID=28002 RepID=A0AA86PQH9_9EUKA|nr:Kinase [Hexamita inflata]